MSQSAYGSIAVQGLYNSESTVTSNQTTTSGTDAVIPGLTVTPPAGTYLVIMSGWFTHSTGNDTVTISIYSAATKNASSVRVFMPLSSSPLAGNNGLTSTTNAIVTVDGSQAISTQWHTNGATATIHIANMDIIKIG